MSKRRNLTVALPIRMARVGVSGVRVESGDAGYTQLESCARAIASRCASEGIESPGAVDGVQWARGLFRTLKIDPTRHRPSSEQLLRRVLKDKPLPHVNTLVDVGNWCSLDFLLPLGMYDCARVRGDVTVRLGAEGEGYLAVSNREINLGGRYVLADDEGAFGSPMTDSMRTAVSLETTDTVVFMYAPPEYDGATFERHAQSMAERIVTICGGEAEVTCHEPAS